MLKEKEKEATKIVLTGNFEGSKTNLRRMNINSDRNTLLELIKRICKVKS